MLRQAYLPKQACQKQTSCVFGNGGVNQLKRDREIPAPKDPETLLIAETSPYCHCFAPLNLTISLDKSLFGVESLQHILLSNHVNSPSKNKG